MLSEYTARMTLTQHSFTISQPSCRRIRLQCYGWTKTWTWSSTTWSSEKKKHTRVASRVPVVSHESFKIQCSFIPTQLGIGEGGTANKTTTNGVGMFIPIIPMWWKAKRLGRMAKVTGLTGMIWPRDGWSTVWMAIDSQVLHMGRVSGPESQNLYFMLIFDKDSNPFKSIN